VGRDIPQQHILSGVRCPTCRGSYSLVRYLGRQGDFYRVVVCCNSCGATGIGTARINEGASTFLPPSSNVMGERDVDQMREFLATFDGNFRRLFGLGTVT
jgi:hypothetical protein